MALTAQIRTANAQPDTGPALPVNALPGGAAAEISNAIGQINIGNMFGGVGGVPGLGNIYGWRVDRQNAPSNLINLSVQRNGVGAPSTVASVFVPTAYNVAPPGVNAGAAAQQGYAAAMRELERAVRSGLEQSFASYQAPQPAPGPAARIITRFQVGGTFSSM